MQLLLDHVSEKIKEADQVTSFRITVSSDM
jgi:hypothetical protein